MTHIAITMLAADGAQEDGLNSSFRHLVMNVVPDRKADTPDY
jgi:hypothetical protein